MKMKETVQSLVAGNHKNTAVLSQANAGTEAVSYIYLRHDKSQKKRGGNGPAPEIQPTGGMKFDPNTGAPLPKFDPNTGKQNWW